MIINKHTQLALRMDTEACLDRYMDTVNNVYLSNTKNKRIRGYNDNKLTFSYATIDKYKSMYEFLSDLDSKLFLIRDSALKEAEGMDVSATFSGKLFSKIKEGAYTYLLGPNKMFKYFVEGDKLAGIYYADLNRSIMEFGFLTNTYEPLAFRNIESYIPQMLKLIIYIELADIEVELIEPGQRGKSISKDVEMNESNNNVYVVDSSWNKLIIRNEGFGVKGHYRLQACGEGMRDRKLIWINTFEKHGYIRRPKARILHNSVS